METIEFLSDGWERLLVLAAAIVLLGNMLKTLGAWLAPAKTIKEAVNEHEKRLDNVDDRLDKQDADSQMILKCMFVLINHDIDGNGIDKLKSTREELQQYLTNRHGGSLHEN